MSKSVYGEYDFEDIEFSGLHFDIFGKENDLNPLSEFPKLTLFPEYVSVNGQDGISGMSLLKYISYMYDVKSPLRDKIGEVRLRKVHAMDLAGIEQPKSGKYSDGINKILKNENEAVIRMVFRYVRIHRGSRYAYLTSLREGLYMAEEKIAMGELKELDSMRKVSQELERVSDDLLANDRINLVRENFLDYVEMETLGLSPEDIANAIHVGDDPVDGTDIYGRILDGLEKKEHLTAIRELHERKLRARYGG